MNQYDVIEETLLSLVAQVRELKAKVKTRDIKPKGKNYYARQQMDNKALQSILGKTKR